MAFPGEHFDSSYPPLLGGTFRHDTNEAGALDRGSERRGSCLARKRARRSPQGDFDVFCVSRDAQGHAFKPKVLIAREVPECAGERSW